MKRTKHFHCLFEVKFKQTFCSLLKPCPQKLEDSDLKVKTQKVVL